MGFAVTLAGAMLARRQNYGMRNTTLETSSSIERILFTFGGIALYNMLELLIQIPLRFKAWKGLYFWSLLLSALGILPYILGLLFKFFGVIQGYPLVYLAIAMIDIGWQLMVTGQSFVLYSRLHLVCRSRKVQRAVLWMIIVNWFISNIPTTVFVFGASSPHPDNYMKPYGVWERLQLCLYFVQEVIISCIYGVEVVKMLKPDFFERSSYKQDTNPTRVSTTSSQSFSKRVRSSSTNQRILRHLLWVNIIIIVLDITLLVVEFVGHYEIQTLYKGFVYSVKLKLEFRILNQLTDIAQSRLRSSQAYFDTDGESSGGGGGLNGSSGSQWDPLASSRRASRAAGVAVSPLVDSGVGVLPDLEKRPSPLMRVDASPRSTPRKDSVVRVLSNSPERKISHVPPLEACITSRKSGDTPRRPSAVRVVSFTEGCGPSLRDDKLEEKWRAMMKEHEL